MKATDIGMGENDPRARGSDKKWWKGLRVEVRKVVCVDMRKAEKRCGERERCGSGYMGDGRAFGTTIYPSD